MADDDDFDGPLIDDIPEEAAILSRIEIVRYLTHEGEDLVTWAGVDSGGQDDLSLVEVLGLLEMTKDTAIRQYLDGEPGEA